MGLGVSDSRLQLLISHLGPVETRWDGKSVKLHDTQKTLRCLRVCALRLGRLASRDPIRYEQRPARLSILRTIAAAA